MYVYFFPSHTLSWKLKNLEFTKIPFSDFYQLQLKTKKNLKYKFRTIESVFTRSRCGFLLLLTMPTGCEDDHDHDDDFDDAAWSIKHPKVPKTLLQGNFELFEFWKIWNQDHIIFSCRGMALEEIGS